MSYCNEFSNPVDVEPMVDVHAMGLDGFEGDGEEEGDFRIGEAASEEAVDFELARG